MSALESRGRPEASRESYNRTTRIITLLAGLLSYLPVGFLAVRTQFGDTDSYCGSRPAPAGVDAEGYLPYGSPSLIPFGVSCESYERDAVTDSLRVAASDFHDFGTAPLLLSAALLITLLILPLTWGRQVPADTRPLFQRGLRWFVMAAAAAPWVFALLREALIYHWKYTNGYLD